VRSTFRTCAALQSTQLVQLNNRFSLLQVHLNCFVCSCCYNETASGNCNSREKKQQFGKIAKNFHNFCCLF